jgi:hypothetical protein
MKYRQSLLRDVQAVQQIAESSIRSQRIEGRPQKNGGVDSGIDDKGQGLKAVGPPKFQDAFVRLPHHHHQMPRIRKTKRRIVQLQPDRQLVSAWSPSHAEATVQSQRLDRSCLGFDERIL